MLKLKPALDFLDSLDSVDDFTDLSIAKCKALLHGYHAKWSSSPYRPTEVETTAIAPIINPETSRPARTLTQAGKIDVIALDDSGNTILIDHKTTSMAIDDPDPLYCRQLVVEGQVSHYMLLQWINGQKIDSSLWDVVRKPSIRPKKLTKAARAQTVASGEYCGQRVSYEALNALQTSEVETLEMYQFRLQEDCTKTRPEWYFLRQPVPRLDSELLEYAGELWMHSKDLLHERKRDLPVRNSGACMMYGTPCQFLGLCSGHDTVESGNWLDKHCVHAELPELEGDGRNVLTNSRIRCFQTCRRKHFYQYELGIKRSGGEDSEALRFGSLWHEVQEVYWKTGLES